MAQELPDDFPEDMPVPNVPIDARIIADVADEHGLDRAEFADALETIHAELAERAADLTAESVREFGDEAVVFRADLQQLLAVEPDVWTELGDPLDLPAEVLHAAGAVHEAQARQYEERLDGVERSDRVATADVLVMPTPIVQELIDAGLSYRQALVQALRMAGDTQERIAEKIGIATGTVKSHCDRIDRKIERAEKLLELVHGEESRPVA